MAVQVQVLVYFSAILWDKNYILIQNCRLKAQLWNITGYGSGTPMLWIRQSLTRQIARLGRTHPWRSQLSKKRVTSSFSPEGREDERAWEWGSLKWPSCGYFLEREPRFLILYFFNWIDRRFELAFRPIGGWADQDNACVRAPLRALTRLLRQNFKGVLHS